MSTHYMKFDPTETQVHTIPALPGYQKICVVYDDETEKRKVEKLYFYPIIAWKIVHVGMVKSEDYRRDTVRYSDDICTFCTPVTFDNSESDGVMYPDGRVDTGDMLFATLTEYKQYLKMV